MSVRTRRLASGLLTLAALACRADSPLTGPTQRLPLRPSFETITQPTITFTLSPTTSAQGIPRDTVVYYAKNTLVKIQAIGLLDLYKSTAAGWDSEAGHFVQQWDAAGGYSVDFGCNGNVDVGFSGYMYGFCDYAGAPASDTLTVWGIVQGYGMAGWDRGPVINATWCDRPGLPPCYTYSGGGYTVTITPQEVDFEVTASPSTANYKDSVSVTVTVAPAQAGGLNVPWTIDSTQWAPAFGTQGTPCGWADFPTTAPGTRTCRKPFTRSGTLTVFATVNGVKAQQAVGITVNPPQLRVTASPQSIAGTGSVTFTGTITPSSVPWGINVTWSWKPDSGTTGGISPGPCGWDQHSCTRTISRSGWKKLIVITDGYTLTDSTHVSVVPCLTGDSILDDSRIRRALNNAWNGSNPNDPSPWNRIERGGARLLRSGGSIVDTLLPIGPNDSPCSFNFPTNLGQAGLPIIGWHMHPFTPKDPNDPLPYNPNQMPHSTCPKLANAPVPSVGVYAGAPGPSPEDLQLTGGVPHIIVDKATVWTIAPNGIVTPFPRNQPGKCDALRQ